jgi:hypothetical protein
MLFRSKKKKVISLSEFMFDVRYFGGCCTSVNNDKDTRKKTFLTSLNDNDFLFMNLFIRTCLIN